MEDSQLVEVWAKRWLHFTKKSFSTFSKVSSWASSLAFTARQHLLLILRSCNRFWLKRLTTVDTLFWFFKMVSADTGRFDEKGRFSLVTYFWVPKRKSDVNHTKHLRLSQVIPYLS